MCIVEGNPHVHSFVRKRLKRLKSECQEQLLCYSAQIGLLDGLELLLQIGTNVNCVDTSLFKMTPLGHASCHGRLEAVRLLLTHGAKVDWKSATGNTPLDLAQERGHHAIAELLKQHQS